MANTPSVDTPRHVGIIMDGNGRWAQARKLPRSEGHSEGLKTAKRIVKAAKDLGIAYLSFYVFSTENWKRAQEEVNFLMFLILDHLSKEFDFYRENDVRVVHSGDISGLPENVRAEILEVMRDTEGNSSIVVNLAINYGGRNEIARAVSKLMLERRGDTSPVSEDDIRDHLDCPWLPDPDLVIRTSGERRTSNFLLWGSAYSELYFSPKLWPDWESKDLELAVDDYRSRQRLYGGKR
jgi:undecaprenyl diphosphate synthase